MYCIMKRKNNEDIGSCIGDFSKFEDAENFIVRINNKDSFYNYYIEEDYSTPPKYEEYKEYYDNYSPLDKNYTYLYYNYYMERSSHIALILKSIKNTRTIEKIKNKYFIKESSISIPKKYVLLTDINIFNKSYSIYLNRILKIDEYFSRDNISYEDLKKKPNKLILCTEYDNNINTNDINKYLNTYILQNKLKFFSKFEKSIYDNGLTFANSAFHIND